MCGFWSAGLGKIISGFSSFYFNASVSKTEEIHASAMASKLYGYTLHLHPICGSKSHTRVSGRMEILLSWSWEWLKAAFLVALSACAHNQRRKGTHRLTDHLWGSIPRSLGVSWALDVVLCLGGWEHRPLAYAAASSSPCVVFLAHHLPLPGAAFKGALYCLHLLHTHRALTVWLHEAGGKKSNGCSNVNFSILSFSS